MKNLGYCLLTIITAALLTSTAACTQIVATSTTTPAPTATALPSATPAPTATALPSATPAPTATALPSATTAPAIQPGDYQRTLTVDSLERTFLLHIPPGLDSLRPVPVVFVFHGYTMKAMDMWGLGFNEIADTSSFIVVYPNGTDHGTSKLSWNAGGCCGHAVTNNIDDIAFVRLMLSDLGTIVRIDPKRIYAAGFSNGAMFSYRLACEMSSTFAAIAPVSGPLVYSPCQPQQPVSVMQEHGLWDTVVPYAGGRGTSVVADVIFPPVEQGIAAWVHADGCTGSAQVKKQGAVTHTVFASCRAGTAVELYTNDVQAHLWPDFYRMPICQMIWDFFAAHPKP
ncbi:MAG: PHB depolymerase family esterase [Anaerolineales bacterium]